MTDRTALGRLLDAGGLEELFDGAGDDAALLYDVVADVARGRGARRYRMVRVVARRRGRTPAWVADRAATLLAALEERRRADLYRALEVRPLASIETLSERWEALVRTAHPRVGGDPARFRRARDAWQTLRDSALRAEYERWWARAIGPFEGLARPPDHTQERR